MKKIFILMAMMLAGLISFSQTKTDKKKPKPGKGHTYQYKDVGLSRLSKTNPELNTNKSTNFIFGGVNFQGTFDYAVELSKALNDIRYYDSDASIDKTTRSFVFDVNDLQNYLVNSTSSQLEIRLAEDARTKQVYLLLVLQDGYGGHIYLTDPDGCYIFGCVPQNVRDLTIDVTSRGSSRTVGGNYYTFRPAATAKRWIDAYGTYLNPPQGQQPAPKIRTNTWTYNPKILSNYLYHAISRNAIYTQFILSIDPSNRLTFVISAVDRNLDHLNFFQNGNDCVLENCDPCPTCEDVVLEETCN